MTDMDIVSFDIVGHVVNVDSVRIKTVVLSLCKVVGGQGIEGQAKGEEGAISEHQLSRLHQILKPFMLRRVKADVEVRSFFLSLTLQFVKHHSPHDTDNYFR